MVGSKHLLGIIALEQQVWKSCEKKPCPLFDVSNGVVVEPNIDAWLPGFWVRFLKVSDCVLPLLSLLPRGFRPLINLMGRRRNWNSGSNLLGDLKAKCFVLVT
mgnify:CR=1 FL=1